MKISNPAILDDIIRQLGDSTNDMSDGRTYANYDDGNIYIDASVRWLYSHYDNYIDGYLEGTYEEVEGWDDLNIEAWVGDDPAEVDEDYICKKLDKGF